MATLYIREYAQLGVVPAKFGAFTALQAGQESLAVTDQTVAIATGTSSISAAFQSSTTMVRLHCDTICSFVFVATSTGTASTTNARLAANQTEYFGVIPGSYVAVVGNS